MGNFFKNLGKGVLYFFAFPGLLIAICIYAVVGLFVFIFQFFKLIVLFFSGRSLFSDLPEDIELKAKLTPDPAPEKEKESPLTVYPSDSSLYSNDYSSSMMKEEEPVVPIEVLDDKEGEDNE